MARQQQHETPDSDSDDDKPAFGWNEARAAWVASKEKMKKKKIRNKIVRLKKKKKGKAMQQEMGLRRSENSLEKYYTCPSTIAKCMRTFQNVCKIDKMKDRVIEPSAGCGAWIPALKGLSDECHFFNLHPEHDDVEKQNWFDYNSDKDKDPPHLL